MVHLMQLVLRYDAGKGLDELVRVTDGMGSDLPFGGLSMDR